MILTALGLLLLWRAGQVCVQADGDGLTVRNLTKSRRFLREDVEDFRAAPDRSAFVLLRGGAMFSLDALFEPRARRRGNDPAAESLVCLRTWLEPGPEKPAARDVDG